MTLRIVRSLAVAGATAVAAAAAALQAPPPPPPPVPGRTAAPARSEAPPAVAPVAPPEIAVPRGDGAPVLTDGIFSPGEWDDARRVPLGGAVELCLKQHRGVVFLGVHRLGSAAVGPSELDVAAPGGPVHKLHVSFQLGEVVVPAEGEPPRFRFGYTPDWYANEFRRDVEEAERLQKQGKTPIEIMTATSYPSEGIEFAIRRSKIPGPRWAVRLGVSVAADGKPGWLVHPANTTERSTEGWQVLLLD